MIELTIHILNYRTPDLTLACLGTLAAERRNYPHFDVILIDKASGDDSVAVLSSALDREGWRDWVRFLPLERNLGFAGGNNHAMRLVLDGEDGPPFQLLLNSDTLVHADYTGRVSVLVVKAAMLVTVVVCLALVCKAH